MTRARAEAQLVSLWQNTFTAVATAQEAWLAQAFVREVRASSNTSIRTQMSGAASISTVCRRQWGGASRP
jgi:hypothetical protein